MSPRTGVLFSIHAPAGEVVPLAGFASVDLNAPTAARQLIAGGELSSAQRSTESRECFTHKCDLPRPLLDRPAPPHATLRSEVRFLRHAALTLEGPS